MRVYIDRWTGGGAEGIAGRIPADLWSRFYRVDIASLEAIDRFCQEWGVPRAARGFEVRCNDLARRAVVVGEALIANDGVRLGALDHARLFQAPPADYPRLATTALTPQVFAPDHAAFWDRAWYWATAPDRPAPTRALLQLLLIKWALRCQPMSLLNATDAAAAHRGDYDRVSPRRLPHYVRARRLLAPATIARLAAQINGGVLPGTGLVEQGDAIAFLARHAGDVVYLDPPYPGTTSYEGAYAALDQLLEGTTHPPSTYSGRRPPLRALFAAAEATPIWLISLNNAVYACDELVAEVRRFRPRVTAVPILYPHLPSLATEQKNAANTEFVLCARP